MQVWEFWVIKEHILNDGINVNLKKKQIFYSYTIKISILR